MYFTRRGRNQNRKNGRCALIACGCLMVICPVDIVVVVDVVVAIAGALFTGASGTSRKVPGAGWDRN